MALAIVRKMIEKKTAVVGITNSDDLRDLATAIAQTIDLQRQGYKFVDKDPFAKLYGTSFSLVREEVIEEDREGLTNHEEYRLDQAEQRSFGMISPELRICLEGHGIRTPADLAVMTEEEVRRFEGVDEESFTFLREVLERSELRFGMSKIKPAPIGDQPSAELEMNLARSINELEFSVRSENALKNARIETVRDLIQKTEKEMLLLPNFGRKSLREVVEILETMGLSLTSEPVLEE
jgi:hypothetical protein